MYEEPPIFVQGHYVYGAHPNFVRGQCMYEKTPIFVQGHYVYGAHPNFVQGHYVYGAPPICAGTMCV